MLNHFSSSIPFSLPILDIQPFLSSMYTSLRIGLKLQKEPGHDWSSGTDRTGGDSPTSTHLVTSYSSRH